MSDLYTPDDHPQAPLNPPRPIRYSDGRSVIIAAARGRRSPSASSISVNGASVATSFPTDLRHELAGVSRVGKVWGNRVLVSWQLRISWTFPPKQTCPRLTTQSPAGGPFQAAGSKSSSSSSVSPRTPMNSAVAAKVSTANRYAASSPHLAAASISDLAEVDRQTTAKCTACSVPSIVRPNQINCHGPIMEKSREQITVHDAQQFREPRRKEPGGSAQRSIPGERG